jgi:murein DD-endopeptidase MepM/ murein hydrolase activator NlpD
MHIEIELPRPLLTLGITAAVIGYFAWPSGQVPQAEGGTGIEQAQVVQNAEEDVKRLRQEQSVLSRREDILRAELAELEREEAFNRDPQSAEEMRTARQRLIALIEDQHEAEQEILQSLKQIWEAQGYAVMASRGSPGGTISLLWPGEPSEGISAYFEDDAYEARFGIPHHAVDIPMPQESIVTAAADGTVVKVSDNGMGFNSLVIRHKNGFVTMYGHVTEFLVAEGDEVSAGEAIALSGGRPGTKGAGRLTTGSHLHFEVLKDGEQVDPLRYLPEY